MPTTDAVTVVIADDHADFVDGLQVLLEPEPDVEIIGHADSGTAAVDAVITLQPDVVLMDLQMPGMNGIEAIKHISLAAPNVAVVVLSMFDDDDSVFLAMRAGARGYLLKGASRADLVRAILAVHGGDAIFGPGIAHRVLQYFAGQDSIDGVFPELTIREREILDHIASGKTNAAIAADLFLSAKTVRNHISNIFAKLRVACRAEAIILARNAGLGRLPMAQ
jgi:DNA-binding NarL/FixJ family response regulator